MKENIPLSVVLFRTRYVVLIIVACFFLFLGIQTLILAYQLKDPFTFVMTFFASNLIILISGALAIGFILRMIASFRDTHRNDQ
jgi:hypothetical protein